MEEQEATLRPMTRRMMTLMAWRRSKMTEQDLGSDDSEQHCCAHCGMLGGCVIFSATANNLIGRFASNRDLHTPA
jgi:hypothetical protein